MLSWFLRILIPILCFTEIIVYNEEVLLFACFYVFVYSIVEFLGNDIYDFFNNYPKELELRFTEQLKSSFDADLMNQKPLVSDVICASLATESLISQKIENESSISNISLLETKSAISATYIATLNNFVSSSKAQKVAFHEDLKNMVVARVKA
jgi:hypothetical protein